MNYSKFIFALLISNWLSSQQVQIVDAADSAPIPFATISFGNGLGSFADDDGRFSFSKKKYADIDTLFISAMGYADKKVFVSDSSQIVALMPEVSQLTEVIVSAPKTGKFKYRKQKPQTHKDLFACWLPTVESEVAILFKRYEGQPTQITRVYLPIYDESDYKSRGKGDFATIFRIQYYENLGGMPGKQIPYEGAIFAIDEKQDKIFELDVVSKSVFIPESGIFISVQVLGYANKEGRLVDSKKYREIKTARGIQKISTSFRPLLPFVKGMPDQQTYVRRIFLNNKKWQVFDKSYNKNSKLIQTGHDYYAMGAEFKVWEN